MIRDADVYEVGVASADLLAGPPLRALFAAALRADAFAHMLYAPARLALTVFGTFVEEAAFAWEAIQGWDLRLVVGQGKIG